MIMKACMCKYIMLDNIMLRFLILMKSLVIRYSAFTRSCWMHSWCLRPSSEVAYVIAILLVKLQLSLLRLTVCFVYCSRLCCWLSNCLCACYL